MRGFYVFDWWETVVAVGQNLFTQLMAAAVLAGCGWFWRVRRRRRLKVDRAIAARLAGEQALEGIPLRMKAAIYHRMDRATAEATKAILCGGSRVSGEVAAQRAEKAVNNTIAWLLAMYREADRLGRLRVAIQIRFLFKVCVAHQIALSERRTAPDLAELLLVR